MREVYKDGKLRARWNPSTRVYQAWDAAGVKTEERPFTAEENEEADESAPLRTAEVNAETLEQRLSNAIQANLDYLALTSPTNAQNVAQIRLLTRENLALIRMVTQRLETLDPDESQQQQ